MNSMNSIRMSVSLLSAKFGTDVLTLPAVISARRYINAGQPDETASNAIMAGLTRVYYTYNES